MVPIQYLLFVISTAEPFSAAFDALESSIILTEVVTPVGMMPGDTVTERPASTKPAFVFNGGKTISLLNL
jgi:hypothetical protein